MKKILIKNAVAIVATNTKLNAVDSLKLREGSFDISNNSMIIADNKIEKIGKEAVIEELQKLNIKQEKINKIMNFIAIDGSNDKKLKALNELGIASEKFEKGLEELTEVVKYMRLFGIPEQNFKIDLTIARGLDYYTGTVYETFLNEYKNKKLNILIKKTTKPGLLLFLITAIQVLYVVCEN